MSPLDQYYFLLHAFDSLGRHLYGTDWTGQELVEARLEPPDVIEQARAPFERDIAEVNKRADEVRAAIGREIKGDLIAALEQEAKALFAKRAELQVALRRLPTPNDDYRRSYGANERAEKTKAVLFKALASEDIRAQAGMGMMIEWRTWSSAPCFRCYLPLSLIVMPRSASGLRRATVLLRRKEFDAWRDSLIPLAPNRLEQLSPEDQCRAWLIDLAHAHPHARPMKKSALRDEAVRKFGISGNSFDLLWKLNTPKSWQQRGAPKGARKIVEPTSKKAR